MRLSDVLCGVDYKLSRPGSDPEVGRVTDDSRAVSKGDMFIAFHGYAEDGYAFIEKAIAKGARIVLAERDFDAGAEVLRVIVRDTRLALPAMAGNFYGHPSRKLKLVGVTGTNGKTTITYLIESILKAAGQAAGVIGTINYRIGDRIIPAKNTTPGALELQNMFAEMVRSNSHYAVMEVSSHALDQNRVDGILFDAAVFTNITSEHLDYHKTLEDYFKAKSEIFKRLKPDGVAILNADDVKVASLKSSIKNKVITYGVKAKADISVKNVKLSVDNSKFDIVTPEYSFNVSTRLVGRYNVSNILAAVAVCYSAGIGSDYIKAGIEGVKFVPGRLERVECDKDFKVFVDFAHTEDALRNVLGLLREVSKAEVVTVFGCGGNRDTAKRPVMGKVACELSDRVIITSDNPRLEKPEKIIGDILEGVKGKYFNYEVEPDRRKAIAKAIGLVKKDSIMVIAGKGHENYQIVGSKVLPFDDREVAREMLKKK